MKSFFQRSYAKYAMILLGAFVSIGLGFIMVSAAGASIGYNQQTAESIGSVDTAVIASNTITAQRVRVSGWTFNKNNKQKTTTVRITNDFAGMDVVDTLVPDISRLDVLQAYPNASEKSGFHWYAPSRYYDGLDHTLYFFAGDADADSWDFIGSIMLPKVDSGVVGSLDLIDHANGNNLIVGWAMDLDDLWVEHSQVPVAVYVDGDFVSSGVASISRPDVEAAYKSKVANVGSNHGYRVVVTQDQLVDYRDGETHRLEVFALEVSEGTIQSVGVLWPTITEAGMMIYGNPQIFDEFDESGL
ncbi:TPA: hypothetical protein DEB00_02060 [Candidatus Uhrbacteria bacterium]|nr:hypothetical protein [Candidatus Uhrbacteria bacterium]